MKIERFEVPGLAQYSYLIADGGQCVVIDAMRDTSRYTGRIAHSGLTLTHVLETHIHADFAAGSTSLVAETGASLTLSGHDEGELYRYTMPHHKLHDGESIAVGSLRLQALHTPGHTPEHLSFLLFDLSHSATEPLALFSGDFLFFGSVGRPDLLGDQAKVGLAHDLYRSLTSRIAHLSDAVEVYPGHGAGSLCGAGMSERSQSTLGNERATNHLFRRTEEDFVAEILATVPPMPAFYPRMKRLNAVGAVSLTSLPGDRALSVAEVASLARAQDVVLLDVRGVQSFAASHIARSINLAAGANLPLWAGWLIDANKRIVLLSEPGRDEPSRIALARVGLDNVVGYLAGGMAAWIAAGMPVVQMPEWSAQQVAERSPRRLLLDVRNDDEWQSGHIAGAMHVMLGELPERLRDLPVDRTVVTICGSGYRASVAASLLAREGFTEVASMAGGMGAWDRAGFDSIR